MTGSVIDPFVLRRLHDIELPSLDRLAEILRQQVLHHFGDNLVAIPGLHHSNGSLTRPESGNTRLPCKLLRDVIHLRIHVFLRDLDFQILLALADVD